jgi:hypothetical protein
MWKWFTSVDVDGNGRITSKELQQALRNGNQKNFDISTIEMLMKLFVCVNRKKTDICEKPFVKRFLNFSLNRTLIAVVQSHFMNFRVSSKYVEPVNNATIPGILIGVTISTSKIGRGCLRTLTGTTRGLSTCTNSRMASDSSGIISPNT